MEPQKQTALIQNLIAALEKRIPEYLAVEADQKLNGGNCALCIVDEAGGVYGKMFGTDKIRQRQCFRVAWTKASQVWITGYKTGEYETLVFTGQVDEKSVRNHPARLHRLDRWPAHRGGYANKVIGRVQRFSWHQRFGDCPKGGR